MQVPLLGEINFSQIISQIFFGDQVSASERIEDTIIQLGRGQLTAADLEAQNSQIPWYTQAVNFVSNLLTSAIHLVTGGKINDDFEEIANTLAATDAALPTVTADGQTLTLGNGVQNAIERSLDREFNGPQRLFLSFGQGPQAVGQAVGRFAFDDIRIQATRDLFIEANNGQPLPSLTDDALRQLLSEDQELNAYATQVASAVTGLNRDADGNYTVIPGRENTLYHLAYAAREDTILPDINVRNITIDASAAYAIVQDQVGVMNGTETSTAEIEQNLTQEIPEIINSLNPEQYERLVEARAAGRITDEELAILSRIDTNSLQDFIAATGGPDATQDQLLELALNGLSDIDVQAGTLTDNSVVLEFQHEAGGREQRYEFEAQLDLPDATPSPTQPARQ